MSRHVTERTIRTFALEIVGPPFFAGQDMDEILRLAEIVNRALDETEENLTDLLPEGYSVRIREWDAEEEHPQ